MKKTYLEPNEKFKLGNFIISSWPEINDKKVTYSEFVNTANKTFTFSTKITIGHIQGALKLIGYSWPKGSQGKNPRNRTKQLEIKLESLIAVLVDEFGVSFENKYLEQLTTKGYHTPQNGD